MSNKIVVTNKSALKHKYGAAGWTNINLALGRLVRADAARGITTQVIGLDDPADMAPFPVPPVARPTDQKDVKDAFDALSIKSPDYLLILGAPDVVPHQHLNNPVSADGDLYIPSDLPYACTHPYSRSISDFLAPSRVTGRLPDVPGGTDPDYLAARIDAAAGAKSFSPSAYAGDFILGAAAWHGSTMTSAHKIFASPSVHWAPPTGPPLNTKLLGNRAHLINCHGATADPNFYGEDAGSYPVSMSAVDLRGKLLPGTVAAAECCFGAELYNPALSAGQRGICQTYLEEGAYGFFGSTNIAYGPPVGNGAADLITQFFLKDAITGGSLGRAELVARHSFVSACGTMSPIDLKTLGQFLVIGDPSIHPVTASRSPLRDAINSKSDELSRTTAFATEPTDGPSAVVATLLDAIAQEAGMDGYDLTTHQIRVGDDFSAVTPRVFAERRMHVLFHAGTQENHGIRSIRVIVVTEEAGRVVASQEYLAKGRWRGNVVQKHVAKGSKSDRLAVVMISEDDSREYVLRRLGCNPFHDRELDKLIGCHLVCEGEVSGQTLILKRYQIVDG